jgi:hypothetical protein
MPLADLAEGQFLVSVEHESEKTISVLICGAEELNHLGCPSLASFPDDAVIHVSDDEGDTHLIKILKKA